MCNPIRYLNDTDLWLSWKKKLCMKWSRGTFYLHSVDTIPSIWRQCLIMSLDCVAAAHSNSNDTLHRIELPDFIGTMRRHLYLLQYNELHAEWKLICCECGLISWIRWTDDIIIIIGDRTEKRLGNRHVLISVSLDVDTIVSYSKLYTWLPSPEWYDYKLHSTYARISYSPVGWK